MLLSEETRIWIYGYSQRGRMIAKRLKEEHFFICGYIDRNPEQYSSVNEELPILKLNNIDFASNDVAVCAISNIFAQEEVAGELSAKGCHYIIYKTLLNNRFAKELNIIYDDMTSVCFSTALKGKELPCYQDVTGESVEICQPGQDTICTVIPVELLFGLTQKLLESSFLNRDYDLINAVPEKSILYYTPPKGLMQYFMGEIDEESWSRHSELWFAIRNAQTFTSPSAGCFDEENEKRNLEDRYGIFQNMDRLFCENPLFFVENPISVVWNEKGWFHIEDGNNRAAFLLEKGMHGIPAKMTAADYKAWQSAGEAAINQIRPILNKIKEKLRSPILHPVFRNIPSTLEFYSHKKVGMLCNWLWRKK